MDPIIEFNGVDILQKSHIVFQNINFSIKSGEFIYLIGKTGSGKSSLLKSLYAEIPIQQGELNVLGIPICNLSDNQVAALRKQLGIIFQDFQLLTDRTVQDNLLFVLHSTGWTDKQATQNRIEEVLNLVHLENCGHKMPYELSGGEQQRATIARALLNHPKIILADEPTGNLDPEISEKIIELLQEINRSGTTVIVATHDYAILNKFPSHTFVCENRTLTEASIKIS